LTKTFTILAFALITSSIFSQSPDRMSYQAIIRNSNGEIIVSESISLRISILQGSLNGDVVYVETHSTETNENGIISIEIGTGTTIYDFSDIDWTKGSFFIKTETDPNGTTNYTIIGTSQLLSVPFALHANTADSITCALTEDDPVYGSSIASGITTSDTAKWNKAALESIQDGTNGAIGGTILWLGTSFPEGAEYPNAACKAHGYNCINNSRGASFIIFNPIIPDPATIVISSGFSLSATIAEMEAKWRPLITSGHITEAQLDIWKTYSYENLLIPYLDKVDVVVIDHGFNDRYNLSEIVSAGEETIDWSSRDRSTFIGAFGYLVDEILKRKPFMKIIVWGYFQNKINTDGYNGSSICKIQEWLARQYNFQLADVWNYSGISDLYIKGTQNYISDFNAEYGKTYVKWHPDNDGNIMSFQLFCPDAVHPHSDLTGNANKRLNAIAIKLL
jgi:hypothetical protein